MIRTIFETEYFVNLFLEVSQSYYIGTIQIHIKIIGIQKPTGKIRKIHAYLYEAPNFYSLALFLINITWSISRIGSRNYDRVIETNDHPTTNKIPRCQSHDSY